MYFIERWFRTKLNCNDKQINTLSTHIISRLVLILQPFIIINQNGIDWFINTVFWINLDKQLMSQRVLISYKCATHYIAFGFRWGFFFPNYVEKLAPLVPSDNYLCCRFFTYIRHSLKHTNRPLKMKCVKFICRSLIYFNELVKMFKILL